MGEVYRADDLKLEQPVALKFLPAGLETDVERLERLFGEVRMARQVSHAAVCSVWDIGEADGQHFLSMEFVDGENLSSLLRRIGRLPQDKALDIAKQISAGLAAAHEKGVLHRDLKPANVMLDGQGKVRITDFGLAGLAEALTDEDVRSGTPSFMSPEQLQGREVTVRSDIYALGLLLYELFTGRRAFAGKTLAELTRKHRDEHPIEPSLIVPGLDPTIERAILACLEKEPRKRPPSARAVSAMLSGQDPLEAAIAAGVTPSPELVAAAGEAETLTPRAAWACLVTILLGSLVAPFLLHSLYLVNLVPMEKPPEVLEDRARELVARLGHEGDDADAHSGVWLDRAYFRHERETSPEDPDWDALGSGRPAVLRFWSRWSPRPLVSFKGAGTVGWDIPPRAITGMAGVSYDFRGQLLDFYVVPPQVEAPADPPPPVDWSPLLAEARLDPARLEPTEPTWLPPFFVDTRAAWTGAWPDRPDVAIRVEAAGYRGRPVWFRVVEPWTRPERMEAYQPTPGQQVTKYLVTALVLLLVGVGAVLARRNLVLGRGDRRGAFRLAAGLAAAGLGGWLLDTHHVADVIGEMVLLVRGAGIVALLATLVWLFYLALEPYVRRLRPLTLVSWTRLLNGGFSDAIVGRDVLIGGFWGVWALVFLSLTRRLPAWLGAPPAEPVVHHNLPGLLGLRESAAGVLSLITTDALLGLGSLLLYLILRFVLRRESLAVVGLIVLLTGLQVAASTDPFWLSLPVRLVIMGSYAFVLLRFGLLAAIAGPFLCDTLLIAPLTTDLGTWFAGPTLFAVLIVAVVAVAAFRTAQGGSGLRQYLAGDVASSPR
jgi:serine/threonine-protein kinase